MSDKGGVLFLILVLTVVFISFVLFSSLVSAETFSNCWVNSGTSEGICEGVSGCLWKTQAEDPWCYESSGCCMDLGCWQYDGTNESYCESDNPFAATMNCSWDPYFTMWYPNGTSGPQGGCMMDWSSGGGDWGGVAEGCWQYDANKASCGAQGGTCKWTANDQNQDPWCYVKNLADAQNKNSLATTTDIGCCQTAGCWNHDNNETACISSFQGNCYYTNNSYGGGWCMVKSCGEIMTSENCNLC